MGEEIVVLSSEFWLSKSWQKRRFADHTVMIAAIVGLPLHTAELAANLHTVSVARRSQSHRIIRAVAAQDTPALASQILMAGRAVLPLAIAEIPVPTAGLGARVLLERALDKR